MYQYKPHGGGLGGSRGLGFRAGKEWGLDQGVKIFGQFPDGGGRYICHM